MKLDGISHAAQLIAILVGSWFAGVVGTSLVWNFIYAIGARVIEDDTYQQFQNTVATWGGIAGAVTAVWTFLCLRSRAPIILLIAHALATAAGVIGGATGWRNGLYGYFCAFTTVIIYVSFKAITNRRHHTTPDAISLH